MLKRKVLSPSKLPMSALAAQRATAWENLVQFPSETRGEAETLAKAVEMKLKGSKLLAAKRAAMTRAVYRRNSRVAAVSLLVPHEICWAAGFMPFDWEMFASLLASDDRVAEVCNRGKEQTPRCSFLDTLKGTYVDGILPTPDVAVSSSAYCAGVGSLFEELAGSFSSDHLHIDIPTYPGGEETSFLGRQLRRVFEELCTRNGISVKDGEERLHKAVRLSVAAQREYLELSKLRWQSPSLDLSLEPLLWHFLFFPFWGNEDGLEICRTLREEVADLAIDRDQTANERIPIAVFSLYPYGRTEVWRRLLQAGVYSTFEGVNWLRPSSLPELNQVDDLSYDQLFDHLAVNLIDTPMRGGHIQAQADEIVQVVKEHGARGMLVFSHDQCQMIGSRLATVEEALGNQGLPFCVLNGDCILGVPSGPASLRLGTFLAGLGRRMLPVRSHEIQPAESVGRQQVSAELAVGVDFGSGFSKYIILDRDNLNVDQGIIASGIDYPSLLKGILEKIPADSSHALGMAGVGSDSPSFIDIVDMQTTEIDALIAAVRHLFGDRESLLVVDIGTQDVKVLNFETMEDEPWCATNKSCGAGTGSVLVQILERWQQSEPNMTYEALDELAFAAKRVAPINTTCGIFAVTQVVSSLILADEQGRSEILRGLYKYFAAQATRHFPPHLRGGGTLLVVGGLAGHRTLQQVFTEDGFELLSLPQGLNPQHVVALGTALLLHQQQTNDRLVVA